MFGRAIKEFRYTNGLSYRDLAKEINISYMTLYKWEKGLSKPLPRMFKKLADYMKSKNFDINLLECIDLYGN